MTEYRVGSLVISKAGHDKESLFIILKESGEYVYLVDGIYRTVGKPKRKNKKHVIATHVSDETLYEKLIQQKTVTDEELKYFIKCYKRENHGSGR